MLEYWSVEKRHPPFNHYSSTPILQYSNTPKLIGSNNHPERLSHPLKQIGEKGRGQWTRISWDEALDTIADKLAGIRDAYGPEQVAFIQGSAKGLIDNYNERLANAFGTPNFSTTGHICFLPRLFASQMTCGSYTVPDYESGPACIV